MELGTGIFLSALFLGTVGLYIATKDRWNWKKIFLWPLIAIFTLGLIIWGASSLYHAYENQPEKMSVLWDVALGESIEDVKFLKGEPINKDELAWVYRDDSNKESAYVVGFRDKKVRYVFYHGPMYGAPKIRGLDKYGTLQDAESVFGKPSGVSTSKDGLRRIYSFDKFNVGIEFEKGRISAIGIYDSTTTPLEYKD